MPLDPLENLRRRLDQVERLLATNPLENASVTSGRVRFIGGTLRVDSGGRVEIVGTLQVEGTTGITGPVTISGNLTISGTSKFTGPLSIDGNTSVTGTFTSTGQVNLNGPTDINGQTDIAGDTTVTGDMTVTGGGRIVVAGSGEDAVLTNGRLQYGDAYISGGSDGISMLVPAAGGTANQVIVSPTHVQIGYKGEYVVFMDDNGIRLNGLSAGPVTNYIGQDANGYLKIASGGIGGGPGDGIFDWPFPLDQVTSEFGMRLNPVTGQYTMHEGIDFGIGPSNTTGTPIPSAGAGVVVEAAFSAGYGNYVIVDHGTDPNYGGAHVKTRYAHMYQAPAVSVGEAVTLGQTLGGIGSTGNSSGNHLHYETIVDGAPINPRDFHAAHGG